MTDVILDRLLSREHRIHLKGGLTADEFGKVSRSKSPLRMARDGDSDVALKLSKVGFSASAVVSLIDGAIKSSIKDFLAGDPSPDLTGLSAAEQQEIRDLASAPVSQPVTFRHLKLLAEVEPQRFKELTLAIAPRDAAEKVRRGAHAAQETGMARPGSVGGGWFARVAKVTAGLLGMAGAAALSVLFPPAAPLIYVWAMAVAAGVAAAAPQGQNRHISQKALQHDVERQRREATGLLASLI
jgi:hypothetical protein